MDSSPKFTWDDIVTTKPNAPKETRPGERAWIVGISELKDRKGDYLARFPEGVVYTIEFEDGSDAKAKESDLISLKQ